MSAVANRRVQRILDAAEKSGWHVGQPDADTACWIVHPNSFTEGFVIYGAGESAKVLRGDTYAPVTQKAALALIAERPNGIAERVATVETNVIESSDNETVIETVFVVPDEMTEVEQSDFCEGALLAASTIAGLLEGAVKGSLSLLEENPEAAATGMVTPRTAAHSWLYMANNLRDPGTRQMILKDRQPSEAMDAGVSVIITGLLGVWTAFADSLFKIDAENAACPVKDFFQAMADHAESLRASADDVFGSGLRLSDSDLEGLLS